MFAEAEELFEGFVTQREDAVAGTDDDVAFLQGDGLRRGVDEGHGHAEQRGLERVAVRMVGGFFGGDVTALGSLIDERGERMIFIDAGQCAFAEEKER